MAISRNPKSRGRKPRANTVRRWMFSGDTRRTPLIKATPPLSVDGARVHAPEKKRHHLSSLFPLVTPHQGLPRRERQMAMRVPAAVAVLLVAAAASMLAAGAAAQSSGTPACASKLVGCASYMNGTDAQKPPETCCGPLRDAVKNEKACLCPSNYPAPLPLPFWGNFLHARNVSLFHFRRDLIFLLPRFRDLVVD